MKPELSQKLFEEYPNQFKNLKYIECGDGWYEIISTACWKIKKHEDNKRWRKEYLEKNEPERLDDEPEYFSVKFDQIKEKYGGLRLYYSGGDDYVDGVLSMAEAMSYKICEVCGNKRQPNENGWISTLCESCGVDNKTA